MDRDLLHAIGIAAGAFLVTSVLHMPVPGFRSLMSIRVADVIVAASVAPGLLAAAMDLGQMTRAFNIVPGLTRDVAGLLMPRRPCNWDMRRRRRRVAAQPHSEQLR